MKVLLIGMDGCHKDVFERGWTPFISDLLQKKRHLQISNDLISRGWLEIALGEHAIKTKALYDRPHANGTLEWTKKFSLPDVPGLGSEVKGIWQKLNEAGYSVGIVNVPTTFPAPKVNGFFISGGGGGAPVVENATEELCYPREIISTLQDTGYIVDNRLYELVVDKKLTTARDILSRLAEKNNRRTETFVKLNDKYKVDFGFIVYKTASVLAESFYCAEMCRRRNPQNVPDEDVMDALAEYYSDFDTQIEKLALKYPDAKIMFVSDHGTELRTKNVNFNILLRDAGLQSYDYKKAITKKSISKIKSLIPFAIKSFLKKYAAVAVAGASSFGDVDFTRHRTRAFCRTIENWTHGIYINDKERFNGPVDDAAFEQVRDDIVECINKHPISKEHGFLAFATSKGRKYDYYPDVQVKIPKGFLTYDGATTFVSDYIAPKCTSGLETIMSGEMLYIKSQTPIAYIDEDVAARFEPEELCGDLTVIHHRIIDLFMPAFKSHLDQ